MDTLEKCPLFEGINEADMSSLLNCLLALRKRFKKNSFIFSAGDSISYVGIVLSGSLHIVQEDFWGNRSILARIAQGELFGEAFSCSGVNSLPVSVLAAENSNVLMIDYRKITGVCTPACKFHNRLIRNMIGILARKNVMLTQKMEIITQRTTREKLISYLSAQARLAKSPVFDIPFNRQELAEYLSVERSAMSKELSKMRKDGILSFHKNHFTLFSRK